MCKVRGPKGPELAASDCAPPLVFRDLQHCAHVPDKHRKGKDEGGWEKKARQEKSKNMRPGGCACTRLCAMA